MNVSEAGRRSTGDLVDGAVHDAGLDPQNHHIRGSALAKSGTQLHKERNGGSPVDVSRSAATDMFLSGLSKAGEAMSCAGLEAAAEGLALGLFTFTALTELSHAEKKGLEISDAFANDAVNVAIAGNLAFDPAFAALEQAARPGVTTGTGKLTAILQDPKNPTKAVLQARADEGYLAAERATKATASVPPAERAQALVAWFKDNGFGDRLKTDVAFTKGVEYHAFVSGAAAHHRFGIDAAAELAKVEVRVPVERPLMVRP